MTANIFTVAIHHPSLTVASAAEPVADQNALTSAGVVGNKAIHDTLQPLHTQNTVPCSQVDFSTVILHAGQAQAAQSAPLHVTGHEPLKQA